MASERGRAFLRPEMMAEWWLQLWLHSVRLEGEDKTADMGHCDTNRCAGSELSGALEGIYESRCRSDRGGRLLAVKSRSR